MFTSKVSVFLIADTHPTMRSTIRSMLLDCGFSEVHEADNGTTALRKLRTRKFDFLITDTSLPGLSGLKILDAIRHDKHIYKLPVLVVTSDANAAQVMQAVEHGVSGYVLKPISKAVLEEKIAVICKKLHLPAPSTCIASALQQ